MLTTTAALAAIALGQQQQPIELWRQFSANEKLQYSVSSHLLMETRSIGLTTYLPSEMDIDYKFTLQVQAMKADGIADVLYERPNYTITHGETFDSPPVKEEVEDAKIKSLLTISPINEVLNAEDIDSFSLMALRPAARMEAQLGGIDVFLQDLYRMALFAGSLESAIDLSPSLPLDDVKPGDTWRQTVGYQPQKLKGRAQSAVQRLDYVYTYKGLVQSGEQQVHRVEAAMKFETDAVQWLHETLNLKPSDTGITRMTIHLDATIAFDLDKETKRTLKGDAQCKGGFELWTPQSGRTPTYEEKLTGRTRLRLTASK